MQNDTTNSDRPPTWRRFFRFSLRTMLLLTTILCLWLGRLMYQARLQARAVEAIVQHEGSYYYDYQYDILDRSYDHRAKPRGPEWMRQLLGRDAFDTVISLRLPIGHCNDAIFADLFPHVKNLPKLKQLAIAYPGITDRSCILVGS